MKKANVRFITGEEHPLYNKIVNAEIIFPMHENLVNAQVMCHYPEDPEGLLVYKGNKFIGFRTKPEHDEMYVGLAELVD